MKRKITALLLVLALSLSAATFALANDNSEESKSAIEWKTKGPHVVDPTDPPEDNDKEKPGEPEDPWDETDKPTDPKIDEDGKLTAYTRDLDFGTQTINSETKTYSSFAQARTQEGRVASLAIYNDTDATFEVRASIDIFKIGDNQTMRGFTLGLRQQGNTATNSDAPENFNPDVEGDEGIGTIYADDEISVRVMKVSGESGKGMFASNYEGFLKVLGNTADAGEAKAIMTWTVQTVV